MPYNAGFLGRNIEEAKRLQEKVDKFGPIAKVTLDIFMHVNLFSVKFLSSKFRVRMEIKF